MTPKLNGVPFPPPEIQFVWACIRLSIDPQPATSHYAQIDNLLTNQLNWPALLAYAQRHGVQSLLAYVLNQHPNWTVPSSVRADLSQKHNQMTQWHMLWTAELLSVMHALTEANLQLLAYKGPVLATQLYPNWALRPFTDLDLLLIDPTQLPAAIATLKKLGYQPQTDIPPAQLAQYQRQYREIPLYHPQKQITLEIQWRLTAHWQATHSFHLNLSHLWQRRQEVMVGGQPIPTLSLNDLLLVLAAHGANHHWQRLNWILDICMIMSTKKIDWAVVWQLAQANGSQRMLALALTLADWLAATTPPPWQQLNYSPGPQLIQLTTQVQSWLAQLDNIKPDLAAESRFFYHIRERWRDRWPYFWVYAKAYATAIFAPTVEDQTWWPLPTKWAWLHYLLRPWRLVQTQIAQKRTASKN